METPTATTLNDDGAGAADRALDRQLVVFRLAQERYGVDIGTVREIIRRQAVTHVPSAPDSVEGMINLRGQTIPVVDLCKRLNLSRAEDTDASRIIVLDTGEAHIGVIVDEVNEVLRISHESIADAGSIVTLNATTSHIEGIVQVGDSLLLLLDLDEALSAEALRAFKAKELAPPLALVDESEEPVATEADDPDEAGAPEASDAPEIDQSGATMETAEPVAVDKPDTAEEPAATADPVEEPAADGDGLPFDVDLVQSTFELLAPRGEELVETFDSLLLERHPGVAPLFEGVDMQKQRAKLLSAIATVVATLRDLDTLVPHLQDLGRRHVGYGAEPAHYDAVGATLLDAIAQIAGDAWTLEVKAAWAGAYGVAASVMIEAAEAMTAEVETPASEANVDEESAAKAA